MARICRCGVYLDFEEKCWLCEGVCEKCNLENVTLFCLNPNETHVLQILY